MPSFLISKDLCHLLLKMFWGRCNAKGKSRKAKGEIKVVKIANSGASGIYSKDIIDL